MNFDRCQDIIIAAVSIFNERIKEEYSLNDDYLLTLVEYGKGFDYLRKELDNEIFTVTINEETHEIIISLASILVDIYMNNDLFCQLVERSLNIKIEIDKNNEDYVVLSFTYPSVWTKRGC